ncbi:hypothetical protein, partial [Clavibacter michiganensis]|uniref:hypothetical protein n=1 Tax=Clavibacter michiganensis TaxID=28447 RepID=UPI0037428AA7
RTPRPRVTPTPDPRPTVDDTAPPPTTWWRRLRRRLADAPAIVPGMGIALAYAAVMTYTRVGFGRELEVGLLLGTLTVGAVAGLIITVGFSLRRRGTPSRLRWVDVSEAIDDGHLPADADADSWRFLLLRRREVHDQLGGPWAVLVAAVLLIGTIALGVPGGPPYAWSLPAAIAVAVAGMATVRRRRLERIDALLQPLLAEEARIARRHDAGGRDDEPAEQE